MIPRTEKGAVEKIYRVRRYLNEQMAYGHLNFDEQMSFRRAHDILTKVQMLFW